MIFRRIYIMACDGIGIRCEYGTKGCTPVHDITYYTPDRLADSRYMDLPKTVIQILHESDLPKDFIGEIGRIEKKYLPEMKGLTCVEVSEYPSAL